MPLMSQPWIRPPELPKYIVFPEMATEFSIEMSLSGRAFSSSSSKPSPWYTSSGATVTLPSAPLPRFSFTMWKYEFSPPSKR